MSYQQQKKKKEHTDEIDVKKVTRSPTDCEKTISSMLYLDHHRWSTWGEVYSGQHVWRVPMHEFL
jgi:hypothetical protein